MNDLSSTIRYLAACHEADNREAGIFDLFHRDVRHRYFPTGTEVVVTGLQEGLAVPLDLGLEALKESTTYRREKSLVYAALLLVGGWRGADGNLRKLCAPLMTCPAELERKEIGGEPAVLLRARLDEPSVNAALFAELLGGSATDSSAIEALLGRFPPPPFQELELAELASLLADFFPTLELEPLYAFPQLLGERDVRRRQGELSEGAFPRLACLASTAMALVPNPPASRGVLFELARLAESEASSPPLRALFAEKERAPGTTPPESLDLSSVPAMLSRSQQRALASARRHPLTLVIGPPGTGKSYTVSAIALDHVLRGESVLVACRTEQAVDVIESKLEALLGETTPVLRGGSSENRRALKRFLERLLTGQMELPDERPVEDAASKLRESVARLRRLERSIEKRVRHEIDWGALVTSSSPLPLLDALRRRWLDFRLRRAKPLATMARLLRVALEERIAASTALLQSTRRARIARLLKLHRTELKRLQGAVRARSSGRQESLFDEMDLKVVLEAFPLWMCTFRDLHRLAPLERELFDLVVVDEATQCDMASPLPGLFRAKRAAVTGDPQQLRHVSFLARSRQRAIAESHGLTTERAETLDYREKSLLDLVDERLSSQDQVAFLDEHYRSLPGIIDFSNRELYGGKLRVMTSRPETERRRPVTVRRVTGKREANGVNAKEAEALVEELERWVDEEDAIEPPLAHSIGVLSPFREQVEHLSKRIASTLSLEQLTKHDVLVGTPYAFQGEERDVMLLSIALDERSHPAALRYLDQTDVFNVSVTRARDHQVLFVSFPPSEGLLARYLDHAARGPKNAERPADPHDRFLEEVSARLKEEGFRLHPAYPVAGLTVDLLVERDGQSLGIDLVGHPGSFAPAIERERYHMLARAGLPLIPVSLYAWRRDAAASIAAIVTAATVRESP